jgi:hypothetical protein
MAHLKHQDFQIITELQKLKINYTVNTNWALKMWGVATPLIKLVNPVTKQSMYLGYDRYGYVIDGPGAGEEIDQSSLQETVDYLKYLFDK